MEDLQPSAKNLAFIEDIRPHPTSRSFQVSLPNGSSMHITLTTISRSKRHGTTIERPCNRDINIALQEISTHQPLKDY